MDVIGQLNMQMRTVSQNQFLILLQFRILFARAEHHDVYGTKESSESDVVLEEKPKFFTQSDLNDLVRDLDLSKDKSKILASRLQERCLFTSDDKVCKLLQKSSYAFC